MPLPVVWLLQGVQEWYGFATEDHLELTSEDSPFRDVEGIVFM
jgi:hypothetical protein